MTFVSVLVLGAFLGWLGAVHSRRVLDRVLSDPDAYIDAVGPLGGDRVFHRLAGRAVGLGLRRRGWGALAPSVRRLTSASMGMPGFPRLWLLGNRLAAVRGGSLRRSGGSPLAGRSGAAMAGLVVLGRARRYVRRGDGS